MRTLDESIARCRSQLRFIPTRALREARVLALLNEATGSDCVCVHLMGPLGDYLSGAIWPLPGPWRLSSMHQVGPSLIVLMPNSDLGLFGWDRETGKAFVLPEEVFRPSLLNHYICRPLRESHVAILGYPERPAGDQVVFFFTREAPDRPYGEKDLRIADQICAAFADVFSEMEPARLFMPRHATPAEQTVALDADFRPRAPSLYAEAVLALFYRESPAAPDAPPRLPAALEADLRVHRAAHQRIGDTQPGDFAYAFSKNHLGRVLLLNLRTSGATGDDAYQLTLHEDLAQHPRLHRLKAACRGLARDRTLVYHTCLLLAEGLRDPVEIARRGGFPHHQPSSAQKIINQAKRLVAET